MDGGVDNKRANEDVDEYDELIDELAHDEDVATSAGKVGAQDELIALLAVI
jgi:hypothetical protein